MTGQAWLLTGPSVILGYLVLSPAILATSIPYTVFLSTSLGRDPGGEYTHISRTFGGYGVAFVGAWLKAISYLGALAFLSLALADYLLELAGARERSLAGREAIALAALGFFFAVHAVGVRWFGRIQVSMCAVLGVSILVLVIPGLFALQPANYRPFFTHGWSGFAAALPPLFFAYAGFESLAQTAGEVRDSTRRLPGIFLRGIAATTVVYLFMSVVAFGTLPGERLGRSAAPMAEVGAVYLPWGAAWFVTLGAVMAVATSLNVTMLAPSRVGIMLARDGLAPSWLGAIERRTGTPVPGLASTFVISALLLLSGQVSLALNIAVFALVLLYFLHSLAFLLLPRLNPALYQEATVAIPLSLQRLAAVVSLFAMGAIVVVQVMADVRTLRAFDLAERVARRSLTTLELCVLWSAVGAVLYALGRRQAGGAVHGLVGQGRKEA